MSSAQRLAVIPLLGTPQVVTPDNGLTILLVVTIVGLECDMICTASFRSLARTQSVVLVVPSDIEASSGENDIRIYVKSRQAV